MSILSAFIKPARELPDGWKLRIMIFSWPTPNSCSILPLISSHTKLLCIAELSASDFLNIHYFLDVCRKVPTRLFGITDGEFIRHYRQPEHSNKQFMLLQLHQEKEVWQSYVSQDLMLYTYGNEWYGLGKHKANPRLGNYTTVASSTPRTRPWLTRD